MVARNEGSDKTDLWHRFAEPLPDGVVQWRQDGRSVARDGKFFARFVAYVDAQFVRERLDEIVPGEWDLTLELLPTPANFADADGEVELAFKARLQILGVIREDVGQGRDYKTAATDAFKRAAVRFGIAHELYAYEQNWVQVDGDSRYAKPVEDPNEVYARKHGNAVAGEARSQSQSVSASATPPASATRSPATDDAPRQTDEPSCPKCGGRVWDNRLSKRNPKAPDAKCRSRSCDGVIWKWGEANGDGGKRSAAQSRSHNDQPPIDNDYNPEMGF